MISNGTVKSEAKLLYSMSVITFFGYIQNTKKYNFLSQRYLFKFGFVVTT